MSHLGAAPRTASGYIVVLIGLLKKMERMKGFEPSTSTLAREFFADSVVSIVPSVTPNPLELK
jgi:hypothetical protein